MNYGCPWKMPCDLCYCLQKYWGALWLIQHLLCICLEDAWYMIWKKNLGAKLLHMCISITSTLEILKRAWYWKRSYNLCDSDLMFWSLVLYQVDTGSKTCLSDFEGIMAETPRGFLWILHCNDGDEDDLGRTQLKASLYYTTDLGSSSVWFQFWKSVRQKLYSYGMEVPVHTYWVTKVYLNVMVCWHNLWVRTENPWGQVSIGH